MSGRDLERILERDHDPLRWIVGGSAIWTQYNFKTNTRLAPLETATTVALIYGVVLLGVGIYDATIGETGIVTAVIVLGFLVVLT